MIGTKKIPKDQIADYISGTTQTALNAKQGTLTLTTTGTSGAATLVSNTLNIPQYSGGGGGGLVVTNRQTASYTLVLTDADKLVEMNVATANNLTIPLNSSVAFPIGTKIDISQYGAGQTTFVPISGVTIRTANSWLKMNAQYAGATLIKIATDEWYLFGNLNA